MTNERADRLRGEVLNAGFAHAHVAGDSMEPTLHLWETVRLEPCSSPRPGDVVAFAQHGGLMVHRVVAVRGERVRCRGDNRAAPDGWMGREAVVGRVVAVSGPRRPRGVPVAVGVRGRLLGARLTLTRAARLRCARVAAEARLLWRQAHGDQFVGRGGVPGEQAGVRVG